MNTNVICRAWQNLKSSARGINDAIVNFILAVNGLGHEDPRRVVHALKVGLAVTIVSLFYYFQSFYDGFGVSAMWAVLTVVVVFEFSVGATLGKGFNRMIATCVAGFLGVLAHHLANLSGKTGEPILLAIFGFVVAGLMTFMRFFPKMKARYDYGLVIFILTFCLVSVSGYRDEEVLKIARQRLVTIIIGSCIAMLICICICPVWSGTELHNLIANNIHNLAIFLQEFGDEYFSTAKEGRPILGQYKSVLGSKASEDIMANLAAWEPSHGRFRFRHPWKQYLKIGVLTRKCAYRVDALNNHLNSNVQIPQEIEENVKEVCTTLSSELGKTLNDLSLEMKEMKKRSSVTKSHLNKLKTASHELKVVLETSNLWDKFDLLDVLPTVTVASVLIDIVNCVEVISQEVNELASVANFKSVDRVKGPEDGEQVVEMSETKHVVLTIRDVIHDDLPLQEPLSSPDRFGNKE